ncbi:MAG: NB-ARC domain-containing protein [Microcoleus anatoxicus]|uniref:NB-ARC domain-containing protein n=1 Tax=Microcoleus anatoxicus TaxID=2705319 RepID=UPI00366ADD1B
MTITEVLQIVDQLVEQQTGGHLDDLEKAVVKGLWEGKTYSEIADECRYDSKNYIGDVSRKLFKILSKQLGEDVNKSNFCWTIERLANSFNLTNSSQQVLGLINTHINLCSNNPQDSSKKTEQNFDKKSYQDLTLAPKITHFYDRTLELQTLSHWLTEKNTRLISVLGLPGIGKTTLVKQFIDLNLQNFDVIIWKSIKLSQSLDNIITEILTAINPAPIQNENKLTQLFIFLREQRCLIILDDVQELFASAQFAGQYKSEYKDYQTLCTKMSEIEHQSSLILISQEQCQEMLCLDQELYPVKCLELEGVENTKILRNQGLKDEEYWSKLINLYEGNPVYLRDIASLIKNVFFGKVADFLAEDSLILTEEMKYRFSELFHRLSPIEQQIVLELSKSNQPVSREDLRQGLDLSSMDLINGLQSLNRRYLLKRIEREKVLFNLSPLFRISLRFVSI